MKDGGDPGVPEAIPRTLQMMARRLGESEIDRLWVFPPLIVGRKEWGLVAASCFAEDGARRLYTAPYSAERTGTSLSVENGIAEEGQAPPDRLARGDAGGSFGGARSTSGSPGWWRSPGIRRNSERCWTNSMPTCWSP